LEERRNFFRRTEEIESQRKYLPPALLGSLLAQPNPIYS
jgi:hypothetical protein